MRYSAKERHGILGLALVGSLIGVAGVAYGITLTDPEILQVVHTANSGEIAAGRLAHAKGSTKAVREFADSMVKDHSAMDNDGSEFAEKNQLTLKSTGLSDALKTSGDHEVESLQALNGAAFDRAYLSAQVKDHESVLSSLDNVLIPSAKEAGLKTMLQAARGKVQAHLDHAKRVQAEFQATH